MSPPIGRLCLFAFQTGLHTDIVADLDALYRDVSDVVTGCKDYKQLNLPNLLAFNTLTDFMAQRHNVPALRMEEYKTNEEQNEADNEQ